jgi:queuosine precursor transporter
MDTSVDKQGFLALLRSDSRYKYLDTFITLFVVVLVITNVIAPKFFVLPLFGLSLRVSVAQLLFPITYVFGDIFTEVYGYSASRRAIWYGFFALTLFALLSYLAVLIPPAPEYKDEPAFYAIFHQVGRIAAGSMLAYWCGEFANSFTLAMLKILTKGKYLWTRTIGSTIVGQAVDTTVVIFFIFYDQPLGTIFNLILSGYVFKVVWETLMTPVTYRIVAFLKRTEGVDYFDYGTNFSPFAAKGELEEAAHS